MLIRILSIALALAISLTLSGCNNSNPNDSTSSTPTYTQSTADDESTYLTESTLESFTVDITAESEYTNPATETTVQSEPEGTQQTEPTTPSKQKYNNQPSNTNISSGNIEPQVQTTTTPTQPTVPETEPVHIHNYSNATCTSPKMCSCGVTSGDPLGHSWKDATCTAPKTCRVCNITEGEVAQHKLERYVCVNCNYTDEEGIAIATNPKLSFKPKNYRTYRYVRDDLIRSESIKFDCSEPEYTIATAHRDCVPESIISQSQIHSDLATWPLDSGSYFGNYYIIYNDVKYYSYTGAGDAMVGWYYELTDTEIIVYDETEVVLKFIMDIDGHIIVTYSALTRPNSDIGYFTVGDICW